jgi:maltose alpha-D-glucosyltransferase/alpha-amylase
MPLDDDPRWYKDAVVYEVHVRAFQDSSNDGIGDFRGLIRRLPWLRDLGVTCLWLLPFYPSPLRDDGYDISDYRSVHPDYGTLRDFREFLDAAHRLGLRVITELVLNHTSDQHPWFQDARRAPAGSSKRSWYVWSDDPDRYGQTRIIFTDTETSNWSWDPVARQYYWHRFFSHQPDLNFDHPPVRRAVERVLKFWLDMGVDGVRLDAVPYLIERDGTNCENLPETHAILRDLRRVADRYHPRRVFLAEANQWPQDVIQYFGDGDECHMAYHFPLMPRLFMALAQEDSHPVVEIMGRTPEIPEDCQWALFLRNHDELTLEMVTDDERDYLYKAYAADPRMRINVGIRRRLAPLLGNSRPRIELLNGLLLSLPGTPVLYYGDEIGMGDNIYLGDRNGVRTPMQWSPDRNAGFSSCEFARLSSPPVMDGVYGFQALNVEAQERDPSSLLRWMRRILSVRSGSRVFGRGATRFLETSNRRILAYLRELDGESLLIVANFSRHAQPVDLPLGDFAGAVPIEMFGGTPFPQVGMDDYPLTLAPHGFYWFRLDSPKVRAEGMRSGRLAAPRDSFPLIEIEGNPDAWWRDDHDRIPLQDQIGPWLLGRPWFHNRGRSLESCRIIEAVPLGGATVALLVRVAGSRNTSQEVLVFLDRVQGEEAERILRNQPDAILARLGASGGDLGLLVDALSNPTGLEAIASCFTDRAKKGSLDFATGESETSPADASLKLVSSSGRHPFVSWGERILKFFHHLHDARHPVEEALAHLAAVGYARSPRIVGTLRQGAQQRLAIVLMERIPHQGTVDERFQDACLTHLEEYVPQSASSITPRDHALRPSLEMASRLGTRVGELHAALATDSVIAGFGRTSPGAESLRSFRDRLSLALSVRVNAEAEHQPSENIPDLAGIPATLSARPEPGAWIRCHGDLHLGQILWNETDFHFVDFEGESGSTLAVRRAPRSPFFDLARLRFSLAQTADTALASWHGSPETGREIADAWGERLWTSFMAAYLETEAADLLPPPPTRRAWWSAHLLERALAKPGTSLSRIASLLDLPGGFEVPRG